MVSSRSQPRPAAAALRRWLAGPPRRSQRALAEAVKVTQQTVSEWALEKKVPEDNHRRLIELFTKGVVKRAGWATREEARDLARQERETRDAAEALSRAEAS